MARFLVVVLVIVAVIVAAPALVTAQVDEGAWRSDFYTTEDR